MIDSREIKEFPKEIVEQANREWKQHVMESRITALKAMDNAVRGMNDEYAMDSWLMVGVPDEASEDDYEFIAENHEEYIDVVKVFARIVAKYAKEDF